MSRPLEFPNDSKRARDLLELLLPTAADSDAFLIDCFPAVRKRMQPLSDRKAMLNLLLELVEPRDVLSKLHRYVEDDPSKRAMLQAFLANAPLHEESAELSGQLQRMMEERDEARRRGQDVRALDQGICELKSRRRPKSPALEQDVLLAGRYKLKEPIGRGGYARVWLAWDKWLECLVVLRVLHSDWRDDPERQARFLRGAKWMQKLSHPHIARVLGEPGEDDGYHFFALEYLEKKSLDIALPHGELSREQALEVVFQVGEALQYMHSYGVVHRDVKPANILIDDRCCARLTDFDAIYVEDSPDSTGAVGTLVYSAPEALDVGAVDGRVDVYSLGMTAAFVLCGRQPENRLLRDPGTLIDSLSCSASMKNVLLRAVATSVHERFATIAEFCAALRQAVRNGDGPRTISFPQPVILDLGAVRNGRLPRLSRWIDRSPIVAMGGAVLVGSVLTLGLMQVQSRKEAAPHPQPAPADPPALLRRSDDATSLPASEGLPALPLPAGTKAKLRGGSRRKLRSGSTHSSPPSEPNNRPGEQGNARPPEIP